MKDDVSCLDMPSRHSWPRSEINVHRRCCLVIAGPNGAGKTTFAREFLPREAEIIHFVNVDLIASGLSPLKPDLAAMAAGRLLLRELERLARSRVDFAFESILSGKIYAARVRQGGHHVQREDLLGRFERGWQNFKTVYQELADIWTVYDNSGETPRLLERGP